MGQNTNRNRRRIGSGTRFSTCAAVLFVALPAYAQVRGAPNLPQGSPLPRIAPPVLPSVSPATEVPLLPEPGSEVPDRPVRVTAARAERAHPGAVSQSEIDAHTANLIGEATPLPMIDKARLEILRLYRAKGFVLTTVSVKLNGEGLLRFIVTEGHIVEVKLEGEIGPARTQVLRFLNRLTDEKEQPVSSSSIERYLLLAQDIPGITLRTVLQPVAGNPGAMILLAQVQRAALSGSISADNRSFHQTGPNEALTVLDLNSFTGLGERTEFSFYHTFPNSQNFGQVSEEFFVGSSGLKVKIYGGYGQVNPTGSLGNTGYQGTTNIFGAQASYPLIRSREQTLNLIGTLDAVESNIVTGTPAARASFDSLRVIRLAGEYVRSDIWFGADFPATNAVTIRASEGLRLLGASTTGTAGTSPRQHERSDFTKVNFEASRTQTLFAPWDGATVSLMGLITGQWSDNILPPAEQFYLGGSRYTRGYYSGQVPGDKAFAATAELQLNTSFKVPLLPADDKDVATQFYVFYDWGETWQNLGADHATKVASAGGGARMQITRYAELDVEALGRFNVYPGGGQNSGVSAINGIGLYWRVLGHF